MERSYILFGILSSFMNLFITKRRMSRLFRLLSTSHKQHPEITKIAHSLVARKIYAYLPTLISRSTIWSLYVEGTSYPSMILPTDNVTPRSSLNQLPLLPISEIKPPPNKKLSVRRCVQQKEATVPSHELGFVEGSSDSAWFSKQKYKNIGNAWEDRG